jgi:hypothetical protein
MCTSLVRKRGNGARRRILSTMVLLFSVAGLSVLAQPPAQAGAAEWGDALSGAIYNSSGYDLSLVEQHSDNPLPSWKTAPSPLIKNGGAGLFELNRKTGEYGGPTGFCFGTWKQTYDGWFTYKADVVDGGPEYITLSINGLRSHSSSVGCGEGIPGGDFYPALNVWITSTAPPSTWNDTTTPPNVIAHPDLTYVHNQPYLFDQTILPVEGPGHGRPAVVSLGDSTISGEGGRWAGNTNAANTDRVDAGAQSYWDTPTGESIPDCHRSKSAEVQIGGGYLSANFACSGAETSSYEWHYPQGWRFKPGVDSQCISSAAATNTCSEPGQLVHLYQYAKTHNVKAVVVAVGANDFGFDAVVKQCMEKYMIMHFAGSGDYCYNSGVIQSAITSDKEQKVQDDIWESLRQLTVAMEQAGYNKDQYTVILQNYWSAIPDDDDLRIPDTFYDRQELGGCPLLNPDATALNDELLPAINNTVLAAARRFRAEPYWPKIHLLDVSGALVGHRLCEKGVGDIEDVLPSTAKGTDPSSADKLEWVTQARLDVVGTPYTLAEGGHANYWGQLAERNCLRQVINNGATRDGRCVPSRSGGVDQQGEPNMSLQALAPSYTW